MYLHISVYTHIFSFDPFKNNARVRVCNKIEISAILFTAHCLYLESMYIPFNVIKTE